MRQDALAPQRRDEGIDVSVVVVVGEARAATDILRLEEASGMQGNIGEGPIAVVAQQGALHGNQPDQAAIHDEDVFPSVVVEIEKPVPPSDKLAGGRAHPGLIRHILKRASRLARIMVEPVVVRIGDKQVLPSVIVVVGEDRPHGRRRFTVLPISDVKIGSRIREGAIPVVVVEITRHSVVGNIDIGPAIVVVVSDCYSHRPARLAIDTRLLRHIREGTIPVVMEQPVGLRGIGKRPRVLVGGVILPVVRIELQIVSDKQIQPPVTVIVKKCSAGA